MTNDVESEPEPESEYVLRALPSLFRSGPLVVFHRALGDGSPLRTSPSWLATSNLLPSAFHVVLKQEFVGALDIVHARQQKHKGDKHLSVLFVHRSGCVIRKRVMRNFARETVRRKMFKLEHCSRNSM